MLLVLLGGLGKDEDVVEVQQHEFVKEGHEDVVHQPLEGSWGVAEAEWHHSELVVSVSCPERSLGDVLLFDPNLVVSRSKIQLGEVLGIMKTVQ